MVQLVKDVWRNRGGSCWRNIGDKLVSSLAKKVEALKVGPRMDKQEMGPSVTKEHLDKVKGYVDIGVKEGAKLIVDGRNFKNYKVTKMVTTSVVVYLIKYQRNENLQRRNIWPSIVCSKSKKISMRL